MTRQEFFRTICIGGGMAFSVEATEPTAKDLGTGEKRRLIAIEFPDRFRTEEDMRQVAKALEPFAEEFNCRFMLLESGATARVLITEMEKS